MKSKLQKFAHEISREGEGKREEISGAPASRGWVMIGALERYVVAYSDMAGNILGGVDAAKWHIRAHQPGLDIGKVVRSDPIR